MINPIITMQQYREAHKPFVISREAQLIIEAGYHCGHSFELMQYNLVSAGIHLTDDQLAEQYDKYVASIKE